MPLPSALTPPMVVVAERIHEPILHVGVSSHEDVGGVEASIVESVFVGPL